MNKSILVLALVAFVGFVFSEKNCFHFTFSTFFQPESSHSGNQRKSTKTVQPIDDPATRSSETGDKPECSAVRTAVFESDRRFYRKHFNVDNFSLFLF